MPAGLVQNPCGGVAWRTLDSGELEVEGVELPDLDDDVERSRDFWGGMAARAARAAGVPETFLLGIMAAETGFLSTADGQAGAVSPKGAVGVMQLLPSTARLPAEQLRDPWTNIQLGSALVGKLYRQHRELPLIAAAYNAGGVYCSDLSPWNLRSDRSYISNVVAAHNHALVLVGRRASGTVRLVSYALGLSGLIVAAGLYTGRIPLRLTR